MQRIAIGINLCDLTRENAEVFSTWEKWLKEGNNKIEETLAALFLCLIPYEIKVKKCLQLLEKILESKEWSVRMTAITFFAYLIDKKTIIKKGVDLLARSSKDRHFTIRRQAVISLFTLALRTKFNNDEMIDIIKRLAEDRDWSVRQQVAYSIGLHFEDCKLTFLEKFPAVARRLLGQLSNDKDWCVRASTIYNIYCFENGNFDLFTELEKDKNQNVRKWTKICADQKPKITDALDFEFANQEYIRDFRKFTEEIEYHADLNSPEETADLLKKLRKYDEMGVNELISKWKKSESPLLRDCFQKMAESDKKAI
jgi:HEAT repeat protein